jgi:hypothetical protein
MVEIVICVWYTCWYELGMMILNDLEWYVYWEYLWISVWIGLEYIFHFQCSWLNLLWIMINVMLTPSGFCAYLSVWMGRRCAGLVARWVCLVDFGWRELSPLSSLSLGQALIRLVSCVCCWFDFIVLVFRTWRIYMLVYFDHGLYLRSYMFCSAETAEIFYIYAWWDFGFFVKT